MKVYKTFKTQHQTTTTHRMLSLHITHYLFYWKIISSLYSIKSHPNNNKKTDDHNQLNTEEKENERE